MQYIHEGEGMNIQMALNSTDEAAIHQASIQTQLMNLHLKSPSNNANLKAGQDDATYPRKTNPIYLSGTLDIGATSTLNEFNAGSIANPLPPSHAAGLGTETEHGSNDKAHSDKSEQYTPASQFRSLPLQENHYIPVSQGHPFKHLHASLQHQSIPSEGTVSIPERRKQSSDDNTRNEGSIEHQEQRLTDFHNVAMSIPGLSNTLAPNSCDPISPNHLKPKFSKDVHSPVSIQSHNDIQQSSNTSHLSSTPAPHSPAGSFDHRHEESIRVRRKRGQSDVGAYAPKLDDLIHQSKGAVLETKHDHEGYSNTNQQEAISPERYRPPQKRQMQEQAQQYFQSPSNTWQQLKQAPAVQQPSFAMPNIYGRDNQYPSRNMWDQSNQMYSNQMMYPNQFNGWNLQNAYSHTSRNPESVDLPSKGNFSLEYHPQLFPNSGTKMHSNFVESPVGNYPFGGIVPIQYPDIGFTDNRGYRYLDPSVCYQRTGQSDMHQYEQMDLQELQKQEQMKRMKQQQLEAPSQAKKSARKQKRSVTIGEAFKPADELGCALPLIQPDPKNTVQSFQKNSEQNQIQFPTSSSNPNRQQFPAIQTGTAVILQQPPTLHPQTNAIPDTIKPVVITQGTSNSVVWTSTSESATKISGTSEAIEKKPPSFIPSLTNVLTTDSLPVFPAEGKPTYSTGLSGINANPNINIGFGSQSEEKERLSIIHSLGIGDFTDQPRLNKITQMTARLLGGTCCVISIVDIDKVIWKSTFWSNNPMQIKEEPRYESFCSWVVQDDTGRGITILDSRVDPRCVHMRAKPGLEFYAGVPLTTGNRKRIGALSIRGSPRAQFSVMDMNILHEMAFWATGEIETISQKRELEFRETMLKAHIRIAKMVEKSRNIERPIASGSVEKALGIIREALRASSVLLLRFVLDGNVTKSVLQAYSTSPNATSSLTIEGEIFQELAMMTLKKEPLNAPLHLDSLATGPITKDVDNYLNKNIVRCASELLWSANRPTGVLAAFFEGNYRYLSAQELSFVTSGAAVFSAFLETVDLVEAFSQAHAHSKGLASALKKHSAPFGQTHGLAPIIMILEPMFPPAKGFVSLFDDTDSLPATTYGSGLLAQCLPLTEPVASKGPKGQAQAQALAHLNDMESVMGSGANKEKDPSSSVPSLSTLKLAGENRALAQLTPTESVEIMSDFSQMVDVLSDRFSLKRAKRCGNMYILLANIGPDTGTPETVAAMAHELFFTLDIYNRKTQRNIRARVGIHCDFLPVEIATETQTLKDMWTNMVHFAYRLERSTNSTLVSDIFYHQTKEKCTYEQASTILVRGQGSFMTYRLIGMVLTSPDSSKNDMATAILPKENKINDNGSLFMQRLVTGAPSQLQAPNNGDSSNSGSAGNGGEPGVNGVSGNVGLGGSGGVPRVGGIETGRIDASHASKTKKSKACLVM
ncbi:hypothetical protein RTP6_006127 [Batrachochytrium dendrobatidis]